jgi:hypothetical protein
MSSAGTVTLSWATTNATAVSIAPTVGTVSQVDGSTSLTVSADTNFVLTASNGTQSVTCQASVDITGGGGGGGGGSSSPRCELTASKRSISAGELVTLSWDNTRTNDIILRDITSGRTIVDSRRDSSVDEDEGSIDVSPTRSTRYTLTAIRGSRERECTVNITVNGVTLTSQRLQSGILLTQTPYTGFEAGPVLTWIFYGGIILWGIAIAYALVLKRRTLKVAFEDGTNEEDIMTEPEAHFNVLPSAITGYDTATGEVVQAENAVHVLEERAHAQYALISSDALRFIDSEGGTTLDEKNALLDNVIARAKARFPKENEWIVINKERVLSLLA